VATGKTPLRSTPLTLSFSAKIFRRFSQPLAAQAGLASQSGNRKNTAALHTV
jgi:hypothetical protein